MCMNHLHCLGDAPKGADTLPFYRWMVHTGWAVRYPRTPLVCACC